jgi:uncharacterized protein
MTMSKNINLLSNKEIYIHCISSGNNAGQWIVYLPLVQYARLISATTLQKLEAVLAGNAPEHDDSINEILGHINDEPKTIYFTSKSVDGLLNMMILPNNKCNFHCSYCYSAHGRSGKEIESKKLYAAIDYFFAPERAKGKRLTISVLGGGEPLLSWEVVRKALDYAYRANEKRDQDLPVSIVTNGSIATDEFIAYCMHHNISLSVSFDILEEIQNKQRGEYQKVYRNINRFADNGLDVALNTVITHDNVLLMESMIKTMSETMPMVKKVSFKPIISDSYFTDVQTRESYYHEFVTAFFRAKTLAREKGIYLTTPYLNNSACLADRYCPGKFVVTAEGMVSICHCVSSSRDTLYNQFIFGKINDTGQVEIYEEKLKDILAHDQNMNKNCRHCIARWHCAGGCYTDNCCMDDMAHEAYCRSMRLFMELYLQEYFKL